METEDANPIIETEQKPQLDAVLAHSFWISRLQNSPVGQESFRGSLRSHLVDRAVYLLYDKKIAKKIVVVGGKIKGPSYPSSASIMRKELIGRYGVPEEDIVERKEDEYDTGEEVETLSKLAQENHWTNVASVSFRTHEGSIRDALSSVPGNISTSFISVEDVIDKYDDPRVKRVMDQLNNSGYQWGYKAYEEAKRLLRKGFPRMYKEILKAKGELLKDKDKSGDLVIHAIDKFKS